MPLPTQDALVHELRLGCEKMPPQNSLGQQHLRYKRMATIAAREDARQEKSLGREEPAKEDALSHRRQRMPYRCKRRATDRDPHRCKRRWSPLPTQKTLLSNEPHLCCKKMPTSIAAREDSHLHRCKRRALSHLRQRRATAREETSARLLPANHISERARKPDSWQRDKQHGITFGLSGSNMVPPVPRTLQRHHATRPHHYDHPHSLPPTHAVTPAIGRCQFPDKGGTGNRGWLPARELREVPETGGSLAGTRRGRYWNHVGESEGGTGTAWLEQEAWELRPVLGGANDCCRENTRPVQEAWELLFLRGRSKK
ncbi:hypothetical protein B0H67DRAFT_551154 [Lasiosphaeris hirsuta]|uniref:Uncharacterized protein n=1 Tax=Lasiosphaeris hirsuta TaxID=260670 RepID=A0AA40B109_9PEZI|nr:hypothetical protein B0H67DRAFT_551154 [Lasiosphaeris hirsuta]